MVYVFNIEQALGHNRLAHERTHPTRDLFSGPCHLYRSFILEGQIVPWEVHYGLPGQTSRPCIIQLEFSQCR